jgi:beta-lactamase superfamily II metal-dependent hydrolase
MIRKHTFAGLPSDPYDKVFLRDENHKPVRNVLWGDWLAIDEDRSDDDPDWRYVVWGSKTANPQRLLIRRSETTERRPLEIIFVDVGQGDGAILITPERDDDERIVVIDAGYGDEMGKFLNDRFRAYRYKTRFDAAVMSHPDNDHYLGFGMLFENGVGFDMLYHSGLTERSRGDEFERLGKVENDDGQEYVTDLTRTHADLLERFPTRSRAHFAKTINSGLTNGAITDSRMLGTGEGAVEQGRTYMPEFAPSDDRGYVIEVLGPIVEPTDNGKPRLRVLGNYGKTKNGHSVILRLSYGSFNVLFGGDLNVPAERFMIDTYAKLERTEDNCDELSDIDLASRRLRSDVFKVCHHGSADVTDEFLRVVDAAAFVISSGDRGGYVHPRPDLLGRLGRLGRGAAPVLLSTELQRVTRPDEKREEAHKLEKLVEEYGETPTPELFENLQDAIANITRTNVEVDGAIYVKTDGDRLIAAFKSEKKDSLNDRWFWFAYEVTDEGLTLISRPGH